MSFAAEMDDFTKHAAAWAGISGEKAKTRERQYNTGELPYPRVDPYQQDGAFTPGSGGGVGERSAPGTGGGTGGKSADIAWKGASPEQRAFLMTLSGPESGGDYGVIYGGQHFNDFTKHPGVDVPIQSGPNQGKTSSAAGRYQFIGSTWNNIASKYHLTDFSPESQDMGAWYLASEEYGRQTKRDLASDLKSGDPAILAGIGKALRGQWTSLPGGAEQGTNTDAFVSTYQKNLGAAPTGGATQRYPDAAQAQQPAEEGIPAEEEGSVDPVTGVQISVPTVDTTYTGATPMVSDEYPVMAARGGAIPDEASYAPGGVIPRRSFTQGAPSTGQVSAAPRINATGGTPAWRSWGEGTPNQLKLRASRAAMPEPVAAAPEAAAPAPAIPRVETSLPAAQAYNRMGRTGPTARGTGGGPGGQRAQTGVNYNQWAIDNAMRKDFLNRGQQSGWDSLNTTQMKEGGMVRRDEYDRTGSDQDTSYTNKAGTRMRRISRGGNEVEYQTSPKRARPAPQYPPAPKSGGGGKKRGGTGAKVPVPTRRPATGGNSPARDPSLMWEQPRTGLSPKRDPSLGWSGDTESRGHVPRQMGGAESAPGVTTGNENAPWYMGGANPKPVTDMHGRRVVIDTPEVDTDFGAPGPSALGGTGSPITGPGEDVRSRVSGNYERGGAIPDDDRVGVPGGSATTSRTGKRSSAIKGRTTKGGGAPQTKTAKKVKAKPMKSRQAAKPKGRRPQADTVPPRPGSGGSDVPYQQRKPEPAQPRRPGSPTGPHGGDPGPGRLSPIRTTESAEPLPSGAPSLRPTRTTESAEPLPSNAPTLRHTGSPRVFPSRPDFAPQHPEREFVTGTPPGQQGPPASASRGPSNELFEFARAGAELVGKEVGNFLERHASPYRGARGAPTPPAPGPSTGMGGNPSPRGHLANPPPPGVRMQRPATGRPGPYGQAPQPATGMGGNPRANPFGFARGGAIPDDDGGGGFTAGGGSYAAPPASQGVATDEAGPWGASLRNQPQPTIPVRYPDAAQAAAPGVRMGFDFIKRHFGFDAAGTGGIPAQDGGARQQGIQRFASHEGASTGQEVYGIDKTFAVDEVQADESTKNLIRIDKVVQYWLQNGNKEKAEAAAASLLMYGASQVQRAGIMAATALQAYQQSGDPQDLRNATLAVKKAHSYIPDGLDLKLDIDPKTRQVVATTVGADGREQSQVVDPAAIPGLLKGAMDGSAYWSAAFQVGQPRLAEIDRQGAVTSGNQWAAREYNTEQERIRNEREKIEEQDRWERNQGADIQKEYRAADVEQFQFNRDMAFGKSAEERADIANNEYYGDWNDRLAAAGGPDKQAILAEGLGYTYRNTANRKEPLVVDPAIGFNSSPYAEKLAEDSAAVISLANALAMKNQGLDGDSAVSAAAALILAPQVANSADGMISVEGMDLVFNPSLLPQLGQLRQKYKPQE